MDPLQDSVNPFHHRIRFVPADYVRILIATCTLFPIRFCMSLILFLLACGIANINYLLLTVSRLEGEERERARKSLLKLPLFLLRGMLVVSGIDRIQYTDSPGTHDEFAPINLFVPHTSFFDLYPGLFLPDVPCWVARAEAQNFLFFRNLLNLAGVIYVKRESQSSRKETLSVITKAVSMNRIAICPEGTCGNGSKLMRFKTGAFSPGLPVQPMHLRYKFSSGMDTTSWTFDGPSFFTIVWLTLCNLWTRIEVTKLPAYYPNEEEKSDARLFADNVRKYVSQKTGIPTSPFIFDDVYFFRIAKVSAIPRTPVCIKLLKIAHKTAMERQGVHQQELTAQTLRGTKSEDGNILFGSRRDNHNREATLTVLREMTSNLKASLRLSASFASPEDIANLTLKASTSNSLTVKSNAIYELIECLEGLDRRAVLYLASTLCDLSKPYLWDRVRECTDYLCQGTRTSLSAADTRSLLWVLLGLRDTQLEKVPRSGTEPSTSSSSSSSSKRSLQFSVSILVLIVFFTMKIAMVILLFSFISYSKATFGHFIMHLPIPTISQSSFSSNTTMPPLTSSTPVPLDDIPVTALVETLLSMANDTLADGSDQLSLFEEVDGESTTPLPVPPTDSICLQSRTVLVLRWLEQRLLKLANALLDLVSVPLEMLRVSLTAVLGFIGNAAFHTYGYDDPECRHWVMCEVSSFFSNYMPQAVLSLFERNWDTLVHIGTRLKVVDFENEYFQAAIIGAFEANCTIYNQTKC